MTLEPLSRSALTALIPKHSFSCFAILAYLSTMVAWRPWDWTHSYHTILLCYSSLFNLHGVRSTILHLIDQLLAFMHFNSLTVILASFKITLFVTIIFQCLNFAEETAYVLYLYPAWNFAMENMDTFYTCAQV